VRSLREAVASVTEEHDANIQVTLGNETEVLRPPHGKDIDEHRSSICGACSVVRG
jgi:hypothetical protein